MLYLKKQIHFILLLSILLSFSSLKAQLNGSYTIGTSGLTDYSSFNEAINDLNSLGINGRVEFLVVEDNYLEHFKLGIIRGATQLNTITFRRDPSCYNNPILIASEAHNFTMSGKHIIFDEINFKHNPNDLWNPLPLIRLEGSAEIKFKRCAFRVNDINDIIHIVGLSENNFVPNCHFINNRFYEGNIAIKAYGISDSDVSDHAYINRGLTIKNNAFFDQRNSAVKTNIPYPIVVTGNHILSDKAKAGFYSIDLENANKGCIIVKNQILTELLGSSNTGGIRVVRSNNARIINNMVDVTGRALFGKFIPNCIINLNTLRSANFNTVNLYFQSHLESDDAYYHFTNNIVLHEYGTPLKISYDNGNQNIKISYNLLYSRESGIVVNCTNCAQKNYSFDEWNENYSFDTRHTNLNFEPIFYDGFYPYTLYLNKYGNDFLTMSGYDYLDYSLSQQHILVGLRPEFPTMGAHELKPIFSNIEKNIQMKDSVLNLSLTNHKDINVYPDLVKDYINFSFTLEERGPVHLKLYDISGKLIVKIHEKIIEKGFVELMINHLPNNINSKILVAHLSINYRHYKKIIQLM